jgi:hypothetical protein
MLTGFRMTSVMRTSTLSSVTKHVGANITIKALILMRSGALASQPGEEFDQAYAEPLWSPLAWGAAPWRSPGLCVSGIGTGRSREAKPKVVMISYELASMDTFMAAD